MPVHVKKLFRHVKTYFFNPCFSEHGVPHEPKVVVHDGLDSAVRCTADRDETLLTDTLDLCPHKWPDTADDETVPTLLAVDLFDADEAISSSIKETMAHAFSRRVTLDLAELA